MRSKKNLRVNGHEHQSSDRYIYNVRQYVTSETEYTYELVPIRQSNTHYISCQTAIYVCHINIYIRCVRMLHEMSERSYIYRVWIIFILTNAFIYTLIHTFTRSHFALQSHQVSQHPAPEQRWKSVSLAPQAQSDGAHQYGARILAQLGRPVHYATHNYSNKFYTRPMLNYTIGI
jgi:hypothetical protein